jgi:TonB family protein
LFALVEVTMQSPTEPEHSQLTPIPTDFSLLAPGPQTKPRFGGLALSFALHGGILALALFAGTVAGSRVIQPTQFRMISMVETSGGSHAVKFLLPPMDTAASIHDPHHSPDAARKAIVPVAHPRPKVNGGGAPKTPHAGDGSGQAMQGNGSDLEDVHPGFPVFSPHPPVHDRSLLPADEQKVVVDVKVDAQGQVVSETLVKSVSASLDKLCLDIVLTWRFQPATVNGKPIPSEAELVFPFTPSYPISGA